MTSGHFECPDWFSYQACCASGEVASVWAKLEDVGTFMFRLFREQGEEIISAADQEIINRLESAGGQCADYSVGLFVSRIENYREARKAAESGILILQQAIVHMLCAACFVCIVPQKTAQLDAFIQESLLSVQDRMGAILTEQRVADHPPERDCAIRLVESFTEGAVFPPWGRFVPTSTLDTLALNATLINWIDRVLSLLVELPTTLIFQRSLLRLAFFYLERPGSDASLLLHGPAIAAHGKATGKLASAAGPSDSPPPLCPRGSWRLIVVVGQEAAEEGLRESREAFERGAIDWAVSWVVTREKHIAALQKHMGDSAIIWRRSPVRSLDLLAAALCGDAGAWVVNYSEAVEGPGFVSAAQHLQRMVEQHTIEHASGSGWPLSFRPSQPLPLPEAWPPPGVRAYLEMHGAAAEALREGRQLNEGRVLIYSCTAYCGGHGDRLNGMLSAAVIALLTRRAFFIDSARPVPLSLVLHPKALDWRLFGTAAALPAALSYNDNLAAFEARPRDLLDHQAEVLKLTSNQRLSSAALRAAPQQAEAIGFAGRPRLHAEMFSLLFEPSAALRQRLASRELPDGHIIGIHFRAGDQMPEHWTDPPRHALGELDEFLDCALMLEASLGWDATLLLFADTDKMLEHDRVRGLIEAGKLRWPASKDSLVHLDRSPATLAVRGLLGVWAEWWTLAFDAHALVLSHSGFGASALELGPPRLAVLGKGCFLAEGSAG